jgi:hypothetical protein
MSVTPKIPGEGLTPSEGQFLLEDSGAEMTMLDSRDWCVLGWTSQIAIRAGTANSDLPGELIDGVAPLILALDGVNSAGEEVTTIRYCGPMALKFNENKWARLLSRNGIVRYGSDANGGEHFLDNEVNDHEECIIFDRSDSAKRVRVPLKRHGGGSHVFAKAPSEEQTARFLVANPHMQYWTAAAIIDGSIRCNKVSIGGRAHDSLPHFGKDTMNRLIRTNAIEGIGKVPLMGSDPITEEEISTCEGCKAKMAGPVTKNKESPVVVEKSDVAVDIAMFPCKQCSTGAIYGSLFNLMYFSLSFYVSHGAHKDGFALTFE